jgi:hypothetical protein
MPAPETARTTADAQRPSLAALNADFDADRETRFLTFPPRNETVASRRTLETVYQAWPGRRPFGYLVDAEGAAIWIEEFLRYFLSDCGWSASKRNVFAEIDGAKPPPDCGGSAAFPNRSDVWYFRADLEGKYNDLGGWKPVQTFVGPEGDAVWLAEYLRYRVTGCTDAVATDRVIRQVNGAPAFPSCGTEFGIYVHEESDRNANRPVYLPDARVEIVDGPQAGLVVFTNAEAHYVFRNLPASTLSVSRPGYFPGRFPVAGGNAAADIRLHPSPPLIEQVWDGTLLPGCRATLSFDVRNDGFLVIKQSRTGTLESETPRLYRGDGQPVQLMYGD